MMQPRNIGQPITDPEVQPILHQVHVGYPATADFSALELELLYQVANRPLPLGLPWLYIVQAHERATGALWRQVHAARL